ncbi:MAG: Nif3-like dinuclear metal center hexameric protein, partial [Oscillospiraceae bacterium]
MKEIINFFEDKFPIATSESWDNVGLLIGGNPKNNIILLTNDITQSVIDECISLKCDIIIAYHPIIFHPLKKINNTSIVHQLISKNISVYCPHTTLDTLMNDSFLKHLNIFETNTFKLTEIICKLKHFIGDTSTQI